MKEQLSPHRSVRRPGRDHLTCPVIGKYFLDTLALLLDAPTIEMLAKIVDVRMHDYNDVHRHSQLDNQSPRKALERWLRDVDEDHTKAVPCLEPSIA